MQLYLWAPTSWLKTEGQLPSNNEVIYNIICNVDKILNISNMYFLLQIMQWLLCLTTKVLCEGRNMNLSPSHESSDNTKKYDRCNVYKRMLSTRSYGRRTMPEYQLIASFLKRVTLGNVKHALKWIQRNL